MAVFEETPPRRYLRDLPPLKVGPTTVPVPVLMAPMAGVSEAPYREMVLAMGAGATPTELVSAKGLLYGNARTQNYLKHDPKVETALWVQVFGGDPKSMAVGAEHAVRSGARLLDVNMGCPVKKVTKNGAGSALMSDPARAAAIIKAMRDVVGDDIAVTAKIRSGWDADNQNAVEVGRALEDAGCAAIAIHPRTRAQGYSGTADWQVIRELKAAVDVPVIANGDIFSTDDADKVVARTNCDAVMIGRAALGNPWIFRALAAQWRGQSAVSAPSAQERVQVILQHLEAHLAHVGDQTRGLKKFRQHLIWYSRGIRGGAAFRERAMGLSELIDVQDAVADFFGDAELKDAAEAPIYDERTALG